MKSIKFTIIMVLTALFAFVSTPNADAQILKKLKKKAENAATKKLESKAVKETNKAMDSVLNNDGTTNNSSKTKDADTVPAPSAGAKDDIIIFSKSDWIAGEDLIYFEDFSNDPVGDFPLLWDTNSSGEVVTLSSNPEVKWLKMYNYTMYQPDLPRELPKDFTIEFNAIAHGVSKGKTSQTARFNIFLGDGKYKLKQGNSYAHIQLPVFQGWIQPIRFKSATLNKELAAGQLEKDIRQPFLLGCHVAISVKGTRYRLYIDGQKIVDFPRAMPADEDIKSLLFSTYGMKNDVEHLLITNLRIAEGFPEPRTKLFSTGKYVTNAIFFDVNSAEIKPVSYGILREIAEALKTESNKKVRIVGHTDSDGTDEHNLELSKKRAMAVKNALVKSFGVSMDQLSTDGMGEAQPVALNTTVSEKAKNRRTEFIVE